MSDGAGVIDALLASIPPRLEQLIRMHYGIGEKGDYTLEEVAKRFAITPGRAEKLRHEAERRLGVPQTYWRILKRVGSVSLLERFAYCYLLAEGIHQMHARFGATCPPRCVDTLAGECWELLPPLKEGVKL